MVILKNTNNAKYHRRGKSEKSNNNPKENMASTPITVDTTDIVYGKNSVMEALTGEREINKMRIKFGDK